MLASVARRSQLLVKAMPLRKVAGKGVQNCGELPLPRVVGLGSGFGVEREHPSQIGLIRILACESPGRKVEMTMGNGDSGPPKPATTTSRTSSSHGCGLGAREVWRGRGGGCAGFVGRRHAKDKLQKQWLDEPTVRYASGFRLFSCSSFNRLGYGVWTERNLDGENAVGILECMSSTERIAIMLDLEEHPLLTARKIFAQPPRQITHSHTAR